MKTLVPALSVLLTFIAQSALAFNGSISFSDEEKAIHADQAVNIARTAGSCLTRHLNEHNAFFKRYGLAKYYGNQSEFHKMSLSKKRRYLERNGFSGRLADQMKPTSCVDLALDCLRESFKAHGQANLFRKVEIFTVENDKYATALIEGLHAIGWKVLYWNPRLSMNEQWDARERREFPTNEKNIWGYHSYRWTMLQRGGKYYQNNVDDMSTLVNFGPTEPEYLKSIPVFVGTAHTGYHTFLGVHGDVIEGHAARPLNDKNSLESSPFNPMHKYGGPNGPYRTGILAVPPGY